MTRHKIDHPAYSAFRFVTTIFAGIAAALIGAAVMASFVATGPVGWAVLAGAAAIVGCALASAVGYGVGMAICMLRTCFSRPYEAVPRYDADLGGVDGPGSGVSHSGLGK